MSTNIFFYCQFRHSLGHFARTRLIATEVAKRGGECFILFGGRRPTKLDIDPVLNVLELPDWDGEVSFSPGSESARVLSQRKTLIRDLIRTHQPSRVLTDYLPLGLGGELMEALADDTPQTRFVWGVPYPGREKKAPKNPRVRKALARYSQALIYTSTGFLDPLETYRDYLFPAEVEHVGVVVPKPSIALSERGKPPLVVGLAGAGIGAPGLFRLMSEALLPMVEAGRVRLRLVAGIYSQEAEVIDKLRCHSGVELLESGRVEDVVADADLVVARCGYNTAFALMDSSLPVIFVPWHSPDPAYTEQLDRAKALAQLQRTWSVDEMAFDAGEQMTNSIEEALREGLPDRVLPFSTEGAARAAEILLP